ncbi:MAG: hypothetical protein JKX85_00805 [Phycisphaeraceae bacterium]|nr:hypothetical protein [Phycisphaeraceae bacterium]
MKQITSKPAHFLILLVWTLTVLSNGLIVLCDGHDDFALLELAHLTDCSQHVDGHAYDEHNTQGMCYQPQDCTDILIHMDHVVPLDLSRRGQFNRLAILPIQLQVFAFDPFRWHELNTLTLLDQQPFIASDSVALMGCTILLI